MPPLSPAPRSPPAQSASRCPAGPPRPGRIPPWSCWPCAGGRAALRRARRFHKPSPGGGVGQRDGRERRPFSGTVSPSRRPYPERQAAVGEAAAGIGVGDAPKFGRQRRVVHGAVDAVPGEVRQIVGGVENRLRGIGLAVLKQLREGRGGGWEAPQGPPALLISIGTAQIPLSRRSPGLSARSQQAALKAPVSSAPSSGLSLQLLVCPVPSSSRAKQSRAAPPSPAGPSAGCAPREPSAFWAIEAHCWLVLNHWSSVSQPGHYWPSGPPEPVPHRWLVVNRDPQDLLCRAPLQQLSPTCTTVCNRSSPHIGPPSHPSQPPLVCSTGDVLDVISSHHVSENYCWDPQRLPAPPQQ